MLAVLLAARTMTLFGRHLPLSIWSPFAYLWQDVLVALLFFIADARLKRPRVAWAMYAALVAYVALNVPITRVLSTPLTWTMLRAARGPLADAVLHYVTIGNVVALAIPLAIGVILPLSLARRRIEPRPGVLVAALVVVAIGPFASSRVDTRGLHRNALGALAATSGSRVAAAGGSDDWRDSPF